MAAACCSVLGIIVVAQSLSDPYSKDLRSGYLLAQAMVQGVDPYLPLPDLGELWLPDHPVTNLPHPTPHPFAVGWLCLPLTLLRYDQAAIVWLLFQLGCLVVSTVLLSRILGLAWGRRHIAYSFFFLLGWWPLIMDLWFANLNVCLLMLFLMAWQALRQGKDGLGGVLLGSLLLLKLVGWPIVLWLALQRRWRGVWAAGLFWVGAHLLAIVLHGWQMVQDFYLKVGPQVGAFYRLRELNFSTWTIGRRLFAESGYYLVSVPLWESPMLVKLLTVLAPTVVLIMALRASLLVKHFDTAFVLLMGIGVILNPITWHYYLLMVAPALVLLLRRLQVLHWPRQTTCGVISLLISLSLPQPLYLNLAKLFAIGMNAEGKAIVPALPALVTLIPLGALCLVLWLLARSELWERRQTVGKSDAGLLDDDLLLGRAKAVDQTMAQPKNDLIDSNENKSDLFVALVN
jgi:hypothetical protein